MHFLHMRMYTISYSCTLSDEIRSSKGPQNFNYSFCTLHTVLHIYILGYDMKSGYMDVVGVSRVGYYVIICRHGPIGGKIK